MARPFSLTRALLIVAGHTAPWLHAWHWGSAVPSPPEIGARQLSLSLTDLACNIDTACWGRGAENFKLINKLLCSGIKKIKGRGL